MSRAVVATAFGGPEVLSVVDLAVGDPGPGELVVEVRAAGVNPADVKSYHGDFGRDPAKLPLRLGSEAAGVVVATGEGAQGPAGPVRVGDEVVLFRISGGYGERVRVPASAAVPKPSSASWAEAAGLMLTGGAAVHLLHATGVGAGDTVLVHGATGGVGLTAVQLALGRGARVIGTTSPATQEFLRAFGAVPVTYGEGLEDRVRALAPQGVTAALDAVGTDEAVDVSVALVADRDRIATIAAFDRGRAAGIRLLGGGPGADPGDEVRMAARLELADRVAAGTLRVVVDRTFPLEEVVAAHAYLATPRPPGKVVLTIT